MTEIIALIATRPRIEALRQTSIPSIALQSRSPDAIVIVSDQIRLPNATQDAIRKLSRNSNVHFLENSRTEGAAGTWNTGLAFIEKHWPNAYVAILDDDDKWDHDHLSICMITADKNAWPHAVVSGIRMFSDGREVPRDPLLSITPRDFLIGNPGWQGSNTFVCLHTLVCAGGFRESLGSCHDRDLALRILEIPDTRISFTGKHTANWYLTTHSDSLSLPGQKKKDALRHFFSIHSHRMDNETRDKFFSRCSDLFSISMDEFY